jgi:hypothetical protein
LIAERASTGQPQFSGFIAAPYIRKAADRASDVWRAWASILFLK